MAGRPDALRRLEPLRAAHASLRPVRVFESAVVDARLGPWNEALESAAGLLLVGDRRRSPRHALPGIFARAPSGRRVPIGWLPEVPERLGAYAEAAASVVRRRAAGRVGGPLALLGQWDERVLRLISDLEQRLGTQGGVWELFRWSAERITRMEMLKALGTGPAAALYFGHGRPVGWAGYHGVRAEHLDANGGVPLGAVLSITCHTANRLRVSLSFAEELVLRGVAAAAVGATSRTVHLENGLLMVKLTGALRESNPGTLADLLLAADLTEAEATQTYRIIGDPLAPLVADALASERARAVFAPAPNDPLPPLPGEAAPVARND